MTPEEALKIIGREAPCPHDSWHIIGLGSEARCEDCGRVLRYDREKDEPITSNAHAQYLEALDTLSDVVARTPRLEGQWTEVHVLVGNDPTFHWKVYPNDTGGVSIAYCESEGSGFSERPTTGWPAELTPKMLQAIDLVTRYINQNPM